ncbi:cytochrome c oxidase subunit II [Nannocystis pusilla]|uniref:C-type cytochrome n=1 Tax=Nannocystis pusilla TaxID=889268 RepID=A0ABS7U5C2_9BACT|nr:c-type cytochrome [Nannocystis pusilla]MBZ5715685.1 c-type cytochrome [Nannocystis pusilla]
MTRFALSSSPDTASGRRRRATIRATDLALLAGVAALVACAGPQSALDPAGRGAERIAELFWWMTAGTVVVWAAVMALAFYVSTRRREPGPRAPGVLIVGGGVVLPVLVLTALLIWGLALLPSLLAGVDAEPTLFVTGRQFWWEVVYRTSDGRVVPLANELRLPVGRPAVLQLDSHDVIHSLWIPALAGKVDMIPGRVTRLTLEPSRTGVFRGLCAEYCGLSHAHMAFVVAVTEEHEFAEWLAHQAEPASAPASPLAARGQELLLAHGCGACHTIRGTLADGDVGPDLTHVGGRLSIAAGTLSSDPRAFQRWIEAPEQVKPGVHMPAFAMLPQADREALAAYLEGLK